MCPFGTRDAVVRVVVFCWQIKGSGAERPWTSTSRLVWPPGLLGLVCTVTGHLDPPSLPRLPGQFSHSALVRAVGISSVSQSLEDLREGQGGSSGVEHLFSMHRASHSVYSASHLHQNTWINNSKAPTKQFDYGSTALPFPTLLLGGHGERGSLGPYSLGFCEYYTLFKYYNLFCSELWSSES